MVKLMCVCVCVCVCMNIFTRPHKFDAILGLFVQKCNFLTIKLAAIS